MLDLISSIGFSSFVKKNYSAGGQQRGQSFTRWPHHAHVPWLNKNWPCHDFQSADLMIFFSEKWSFSWCFDMLVKYKVVRQWGSDRGCCHEFGIKIWHLSMAIHCSCCFVFFNQWGGLWQSWVWTWTPKVVLDPPHPGCHWNPDFCPAETVGVSDWKIKQISKFHHLQLGYGQHGWCRSHRSIFGYCIHHVSDDFAIQHFGFLASHD